MTQTTPRRPAPPALEAHVKQLFPLEMSPEEFAGRDGEGWNAFDFASYHYSDPALDAWIQRFGQILATPGRVEQLQRQYLSPDEWQRLAILRGLIEDEL